MALNVDISKMEECTVRLGDGTVATISPKKIAQRCLGYIDMLLANSKTKFLAPYLNKKIIWSFRPNTAWTDGIRITVNPVFAYEQLLKGFQYKKDNLEKLAGNIKDENQKGNILNGAVARYFQFVIIHECYHQVYEHTLRANRLGVTDADHDLANIAMDLEINRDIESQLPAYSGCTEEINGIWFRDSKFKKNAQYIADHPGTSEYFNFEMWEDVFNYLKDYPVEWDNKVNDNMGGSDPKAEAHPAQYENGWNDAIDAIENNIIDPRKL